MTCSRHRCIAVPILLLTLALGAPRLVAAETPRTRPLPGLRGDVAAIILAGAEGGAFSISTLAWPEQVIGESGKVEPAAAVAIEIDGPGLFGDEAPTGDERLLAEAFVYALGDGDRLAGHWSRLIAIDETQAATVLDRGGLKVVARLPLPAGTYDLRVLIHEPSTRRFALRRRSLRVGGGTGGDPGPPLFADDAAAWALAADAGATDSGPQPATRPVLRAGRPWQARLPLETLPERLELRLLGTDGQVVHEGPVETTPVADGNGFVARGTTPSLVTGTYTFTLVSGRRSKAATEPLVLYVLGEAQADLALRSWTDVLNDRLGSLPSVAPREDAPAPDTASREAEIYRDALGRLAAGDRGAAEEAVAELERSAWSPEQGAELASTAQDAVVDALAKADPESLLPVLALHRTLCMRYAAERAYFLAGPARARVAHIAERYAELSEDERAGRHAADVLVALAVDLSDRRLDVRARRLLDRALRLEPTHPAARLRLAILLERVGDYAAATETLEALAPQQRSAEAALRLALNLRRIGRGAEGRRILRRLIDRGRDGWPIAVAFQELGRDLIKAGDLERAERLLRAGVSRFPADGGLRVQLAYLLDRGGNAIAGQTLLATGNTRHDPSARLRYHHRSARRAAPRDAFDDATLARLPLLAQALEASGKSRRRR